jgi:hypothetical protein
MSVFGVQFSFVLTVSHHALYWIQQLIVWKVPVGPHCHLSPSPLWLLPAYLWILCLYQVGKRSVMSNENAKLVGLTSPSSVHEFDQNVMMCILIDMKWKLRAVCLMLHIKRTFPFHKVCVISRLAEEILTS